MAAEGTTFAFSEVRLGLVPATISPFVLRAIGPGATRALFTTGRRFDADEARRLGLVHDVASEELVEGRVAETVDELLQAGPAAVLACKQLVRQATSALSLDDLPERIAARPDRSGGPRGRCGVPRATEPVVAPPAPDREPR